MAKFRTIDSFFKKNEDSNSENSTLLGSNVEASTSNERPSKSPRVDPEKHPSRSSVVEVELFYISYTHKKKNLYMTLPNINSWFRHCTPMLLT